MTRSTLLLQLITGAYPCVLHAAVINGRLEMVRVLLKQGASVDAGGLGSTAPWLLFHGRLSILLVLLQHSADPDCRTSRAAPP